MRVRLGGALLTLPLFVGCTANSSQLDSGGDSTDSDSSAEGEDTSAEDEAGESESESTGDGGEPDMPLPPSDFPTEEPTVMFPKTRLDASELGVLVNMNDPASVETAAAYVEARGIPPENVVELSIPIKNVLTPVEFEAIEAEALAMLDDSINALAITWTTPYRVGCNSITAAFGMGYSAVCGGCVLPNESDLYDSESFNPWVDLGMRPTMMLTGKTTESVDALIQRGLDSMGTHPTGDGYFIRTTDAARSVRFGDFELTVATFDFDDALDLTYIDNADGMGSNLLENTTDVLFYLTGLANVAGIDTNTYLPGAVADHLTSFGGQVPESSQMSALEWLEAGATGSYGTVVEPCNYTEKFPRASVLLPHYFRGQTLVEAYWKSVLTPAEGLFLGDPLASPWDGSTVSYEPGVLTITTTLMRPGVDYWIQEGPSEDGPWETLLEGQVGTPLTLDLVIEDAVSPFYRIIKAQ